MSPPTDQRISIRSHPSHPSARGPLYISTIMASFYLQTTHTCIFSSFPHLTNTHHISQQQHQQHEHAESFVHPGGHSRGSGHPAALSNSWGWNRCSRSIQQASGVGPEDLRPHLREGEHGCWRDRDLGQSKVCSHPRTTPGSAWNPDRPLASEPKRTTDQFFVVLDECFCVLQFFLLLLEEVCMVTENRFFFGVATLLLKPAGIFFWEEVAAIRSGPIFSERFIFVSFFFS